MDTEISTTGPMHFTLVLSLLEGQEVEAGCHVVRAKALGWALASRALSLLDCESWLMIASFLHNIHGKKKELSSNSHFTWRHSPAKSEGTVCWRDIRRLPSREKQASGPLPDPVSHYQTLLTSPPMNKQSMHWGCWMARKRHRATTCWPQIITDSECLKK